VDDVAIIVCAVLILHDDRAVDACHLLRWPASLLARHYLAPSPHNPDRICAYRSDWRVRITRRNSNHEILVTMST
jgi:hypothetical protein